MSLENRIVELYIVNDLGFDYSKMRNTLGELTAFCNGKYCPMGVFQCPIDRKLRCEDVTVDMWAKVFGVKDEDDAHSS